jgi:hypothetical protein
METTLCADKTSGGEFFQILRFRYQARSLRARVTGRPGPKFPVWSVHFTWLRYPALCVWSVRAIQSIEQIRSQAKTSGSGGTTQSGPLPKFLSCSGSFQRQP